MKKFFTYLLCGLCLTSPVLAQTTGPVVVQPPTGSDPGAPDPTPATPTDPTRATLDNLFAPLDKSQVPTGFLAEDALPLVPLDVFNGTLTDSSRTSPDGFRYLYATLYSAHVSGTQPLLSMQDYNARTAAAVAAVGPTVIPIMVQRVEYATVRPDAFSANLLAYSNGQVRDVAGRAQNPYLVRTAFAAAPTSSYSTTSTVSLVLSSALEVRSTGIPISNRYLDFGDGRGYLIATPDQPLTASYSTTGPKRIKVRYTYSNTSILESWFDITVLNIAASPAAATVGSGGKGYSTLGTFDGRVNPVSGVRAGGTAYVILGASHTQITKPFIVAEGFDPSDVAPLIQRNLNINDFTTATFTSGTFNFYNSYINAGYDLIYIDYDRGTGDVLLNAALFEEVLNRVNAAKVGSEQNVVMGISMGGVIARYQLADMVKNNRPTQTRLLILQDSPQRGANVPLGIQALLRQANINFGSFTIFDINKYLQQATALLDSPASQQLLLYRATNATSGFAANTFIEGAYRQKITFPAGQTPPYQIIAASQGSQCGTPLFAPYTELLRLDGKIFISPLPWIKRTTYYAQTIVNAIPAGGQSNRVATLQLYTILRLFGFINLRVNFIRQDYSCPSGLLAVDGVAGGTNYIGGYIPAGVLPPPASYGFGPFFQLAYSYTFTQNFCFVPTASALDLNDFNQTTLGGKNINGISSASFTRTNGFIAYSPQENPTSTTSAYSNEFHTTFTARNTEWIFNKMQNLASPSSYCSTECSPPVTSTITGPTQLCPGATAIYTVSNLPANAQVRWSVSPSGIVTPNSGMGNSFSVQALSGAGGQATIQATLITGGSCELPLPSISLAVGASYVGIGIYGGCGGLPATFTASGQSLGTNYRWTINGQAQAQFNDQAQITYTLPSDPSIYQIPVMVTVASTCPGSGTLSDTYNVVIEHGAGCANEIVVAQPPGPTPVTASIYPNPAHESVYVHLENANVSQPTTVRLFDSQGQLRLEQVSKGEATIALKVNSLLPGIYLVHVLRSNKVITRQQLQIE